MAIDIRMNNRVVVFIPDLGSKKSVTRKNMRLLNNKPLIMYSIENARKLSSCADVCVITNDAAMVNLCNKNQVSCLLSSINLASDDLVLDPVIYEALLEFEKINSKVYETVITLQPTSPLLREDTLIDALRYYESAQYDSIVSAINRPNLSWSTDGERFIPNYEIRANRHYLPKCLVETGTFIISKRSIITQESRLGSHSYIYEIAISEGLEIKNNYDWLIAEKELQKKKVIIRFEAYSQIGTGHFYRGTQLYNILDDHMVVFSVSERSKFAILKFEELGYEYIVNNSDDEFINHVDDGNYDIVVNDILDTSDEYIKRLKKPGRRIVNIEDSGTGALFADVVINALYEEKEVYNNLYAGAKYYCLREDFFWATRNEFSEKVSNILVLFGGTDPAQLTMKTLEACEMLHSSDQDIVFTFIIGGGNDKKSEIEEYVSTRKAYIKLETDVNNIGDYMEKKDIAISSMGRTMYELAYMRVPTILMGQNIRELSHKYGNIQNGFINLGLGENVSEQTIAETIEWLIRCPQVRKQLFDRMMQNDLSEGIKRVKKLILGDE